MPKSITSNRRQRAAARSRAITPISKLRPVVQEDRTGCAVACVAALTGRPYAAAKQLATSVGVSVDDPRLWGDTRPMRTLLRAAGLRAGAAEESFTGWKRLPSLALLAIKWHREKTGPAWHWVVFARNESGAFVLDSKRGLRMNRRTDFGRIKPKWFIRLDATNA